MTYLTDRLVLFSAMEYITCLLNALPGLDVHSVLSFVGDGYSLRLGIGYGLLPLS